MRAKLKRLHSPDIDDLENYHPDIRDNFAFLLQLMVGPAELDGEESFDVEVCTPLWLEDNYGRQDVVVGRHYLIVREYSFPRIVHAIDVFLASCSGENWDEIAIKVARLGKWEFEDYVE